MLMALSLAEKLGKRGLRAFSLHPGVINTNLGNHLDWSVELDAMRMLIPPVAGFEECPVC
jgi:NAD(P)-dependent dehydrogenase (short-subunit alcohol dehydrogenase family)